MVQMVLHVPAQVEIEVNVLIVDDSKFVTKAMHSILEELHLHVVGVAHDGVDGFESFSRLLPDLTLLDVTMPNMDGVECLGKIKESKPDARVVMLSAVQDEETIQKCMQAGAAGFLQKPIRKDNANDMGRLIAVLERALGRMG